MSDISRAQAYLRNSILLLALAGLIYFAGREFLGPKGVDSGGEPIPLSAKVVVYYFSTGKECVTCEQIPAYAQEALEAGFAAEVAAGTVVWRAYDVDQPEFAHFVQDYGVYTKAIVLARMDKGQQVRWKNLEKVWDLVGDRAAFVDYVRGEIRAMLDAGA